MTKPTSHSLRLFYSFALLVLLGAAASLAAQSTILSMPSTDILPEGKIGIRFAARFKPNDEKAKKKFSAFTPRVIYGLTKDIEIGVNLNGNVQPGADTTTLVPAVKWRFYQNEKHKTALVTGTNVFIPLRNKKYNIGNHFYLLGSKGFSKTGTKLTAGTYYYTANVVAKNAARVGGQFGLEQKINAKWGFAAEWMTGRHSSGYATAAFKYKMNKRTGVNFGYTVMNDRALQGNHFFYTSFSINLR